MLQLMQERDTLGVVGDQFGAPTYAKTLAGNVLGMIAADSNQYGTYHYSDEGVISWYDIACEIYSQGRQAGIIAGDVSINKITSDEYKTPAKRPKWSAFDKSKVKNELKFQINDWKYNLADYINEFSKKLD
jgi:dTDP-4-dehydrorhamnose reductase